MRNHNEKIKDMTESVLPSKRRRGARLDRRQIHAKERARIRAEIHAYRTAIDPEGVETDLRADARHEIARMVSDRRDADKVAPLIRWAVRRVELDPALRSATVADQIESFRRLLPDDLIGRHALSHIEAALEWEARQRRASEPDHHGRDEQHAQRRAVVMRVLESGQHAQLNALLWKQVVRERLQSERKVDPRRPATVGFHYFRPSTPWRPLLGIHDVDDFVEAVMWIPSVRSIVESVVNPVGRP